MTGPSKPERRPWSRRETGILFFGLAMGYGGYPAFARLLVPTGSAEVIMTAVTIALLVAAFVMMSRP